ncbi:MAG TPA: MBL fold metallo-hydrolase [Polyangiaceae bacterium LLY-WYZ-14_1]|nr:MBL fold metallo-hydrolase [Polyangiaceae bacterium LLY-WYZ-14_1]
MQIRHFYDPATFTLTFLVHDPETKDAVVIDPVLDYNPLGSQTSTTSVDAISEVLRREGLQLRGILETHAHADHLSGSQLLKRRHEADVAIGERITVVQETFKGLFDLPDSFPTDGSQFDRLLADGEVFQAGSIPVETIATPGHTPACVTYKIGDAIFTGDALFIEDFGTGRCDFPKGSAEDLYDSIQGKLYTLPDDTRVFVGHDYQPGGRELRWETTIGRSKAENVQLKASTGKEEFVRFRKERDATLAAPKLLFQSVQVNVDAGRLPGKRANGNRYLNIPINLFGPTDDIGQPAT